MAPDGLTDGKTDGRKDGHRQTYIPPPSAGDNKFHYTCYIRATTIGWEQHDRDFQQ